MASIETYRTMPLLSAKPESRGIVVYGDIPAPAGIEKRRSDFNTWWCGGAIAVSKQKQNDKL